MIDCFGYKCEAIEDIPPHWRLTNTYPELPSEAEYMKYEIWNEEREECVVRRLLEGATTPIVAREIGISEKRVREKAKELNLRYVGLVGHSKWVREGT